MVQLCYDEIMESRPTGEITGILHRATSGALEPKGFGMLIMSIHITHYHGVQKRRSNEASKENVFFRRQCKKKGTITRYSTSATYR